MKRTFIALDVIPTAEFEDFCHSISTKIQGRIKWYETNKLHLTLGFFGSTSKKQEEQITVALKRICAQNKPFILDFQGLGVFPTENEPRVIWIGIKNSKKLLKLYKELRKELIQFDLPRDNKKFFPHITIGRIKGIEDKEQLLQVITEYHDREIMHSTIREITYYESVLTPSGSIYKVLSVFQLF